MEHAHQNIERYLTGDLNGAALAEFEQAMQSDSTLAQSVAQHREMMQRLDALRLRNKVKAATQTQRQSSGQALYTRRKYWALAASFVLLATAVCFFYQQGKPERSDWADEPAPPSPAEQPIVVPETIPIEQTPHAPPSTQANDKRSRQLALARTYLIQPSSSMIRNAAQQSNPTAPKSTAQQAAEAYEKRDFSIAAELLKNDSLVQRDDAIRFLRANARFQIGQFASAALDFDALNQSFQLKHEARWNTLLCLLAQGKNEQAEQQRKAMLQEEDFPFREMAVRLGQSLSND